MTLLTNLDSYYKLDESSGNAADSVGSNTLTNNNSIAYSAGKINNGANFVRTSSKYFSFVNAPVSGSNAFSFSLWIKSSGSTTNTLALITFGTLGANDYFTMSVGSSTPASNGKISANIFGGTGLVTSTSSVTDGTFKHIVITKASGNSTMKLYINGTLEATSASFTPNFTNANAFVGRESTNYFDGSVDEFGIWSREITSGEVTSLYNAGSGIQYPFIQIQVSDTSVSSDVISMLTKIFLSTSDTSVSSDSQRIGIGWSNRSKSSSGWSNRNKS